MTGSPRTRLEAVIEQALPGEAGRRLLWDVDQHCGEQVIAATNALARTVGIHLVRRGHLALWQELFAELQRDDAGGYAVGPERYYPNAELEFLFDPPG